MEAPPNEPGAALGRFFNTIRSHISDAFYGNFESVFICTILVTILFIFYFCEYKLALLGLFFLPIILSGYFLNTRSAVLGGLMSILVVNFFFIMNPSAFTHEMPNTAPYIYI